MIEISAGGAPWWNSWFSGPAERCCHFGRTIVGGGVLLFGVGGGGDAAVALMGREWSSKFDLLFGWVNWWTWWGSGEECPCGVLLMESAASRGSTFCCHCGLLMVEDGHSLQCWRFSSAMVGLVSGCVSVRPCRLVHRWMGVVVIGWDEGCPCGL